MFFTLENGSRIINIEDSHNDSVIKFKEHVDSIINSVVIDYRWLKPESYKRILDKIQNNFNTYITGMDILVMDRLVPSIDIDLSLNDFLPEVRDTIILTVDRVVDKFKYYTPDVGKYIDKILGIGVFRDIDGKWLYVKDVVKNRNDKNLIVVFTEDRMCMPYYLSIEEFIKLVNLEL